mgnify:CR=1 FL=1
MAGLKAGLLICEACEFNRSFHDHHPSMALIANIEEDHLDIYESLDAIIEAFRVFAQHRELDIANALAEQADAGRGGQGGLVGGSARVTCPEKTKATENQ